MNIIMHIKNGSFLKSARMLVKAVLVFGVLLGVLLGNAEQAAAATEVVETRPEIGVKCPATITATVSQLMKSGALFNMKEACKNNFFDSYPTTPAQDIAVVTAAAIAKNGGKDTTKGASGACDVMTLVATQTLIQSYCTIRTTDEKCKGDKPTDAVTAVGSSLTCGSKTTAETCATKIDALINPKTCSLNPAQKTQLEDLAEKAGICAGTNQGYGGNAQVFVQEFCKKTKDQNCNVGLQSGEVSCEGGVYLGVLIPTSACATCDIIEKMVAVTGELGEKVYNGIQKGTVGLLSVSVALWIALQVGKLLFPFGPLDRVTGIFNGIVTRLGITLIVGTMLLSFGSYWKYIYAPVIVSGANYTGTILAKANGIVVGTDSQIRFGCTDNITIDPKATVATDSAKIGKALTCLTKEMQDTIYTGLAFSVKAMFAAMLQGKKNKTPQSATDNFALYFADKYADLLNSLNVWGKVVDFIAAAPEAVAGGIFTAFLAFIGGGILLLTWLPLYMNLPFRIADIVIRWTLLSMLSPLFIAAAVFPATRSFMVAGLRGIVQSAFELMLIGVIIALCTAAVTEVLHDAEGNTVPFLLNSALFLQLWTIAWLGNVMMSKVKSFSAAFADPDDVQGRGLDTSVAADYASSMEKMATSAATKGKDLATDRAAVMAQGKVT